MPAAMTVLNTLAGTDPTTTGADRLSLALPATGLRLADIVRELDRAGVAAADVSLRRPTLDEVFLRLTDRKESVR
ncbi:daunorubicin/doxorubicin resistance ABC transporter ATP-binding protein DrrA, partial [Nonomuraea sp. H19]